MQIIDFIPSYQKETEEFIKSIYEEMGWIAYWESEFSNLYEHFNLPTGGFFLIAIENNKPIATAALQRLNSDIGIARKFYVHKDYRGKGFAQDMLAAFIAKAKGAGIEKIVLDVLKTNVRAIKFYEKSGFKRYMQNAIESWSESQ